MPVFGLPDMSGSTDSSADGGDGGILSGLSGLFSTIGTSVSQVYRSVNAPSGPVAGQIYNPQTGTYQPVGGIGQQLGLTGGNTGILLILGVGLVAILLLRR